MFVGREQELRKLNRMYESDKLEVAVIYGRRRVGKTTLINEFCKGKRTVFFAAQENSAGQNLEALSEAITETLARQSLLYRSFADAMSGIDLGDRRISLSCPGGKGNFLPAAELSGSSV